MSWHGSGGFFGASVSTGRPSAPAAILRDPLRPDGTPGPASAGLEELRQLAQVAYGQGRLADAAELQHTILAMGRAAGGSRVDDFLFAGLIHDASGCIADSLSILRDGLSVYPGEAALHENLAVALLHTHDIPGAIAACEAALSLGSTSPNVQDCLCEAHQRSGRLDLALTAGRLALEAKDQRFGGAAPVVAMPETLPPPFNPNRPEENVIAYSLWGNAPRYHVPLLENVRMLPHLFPAWTIRVYHDQTVDQAYLAELAARNVQLRPTVLPRDVADHRALLWRFEVIADPTVRRFLIRDADSLLTVKERMAVDAWLCSDFHFHAMRDWYTHTDLLLAGMWGGVGGILPGPSELLRAHPLWRMETSHIDQDLLTVAVWPAVRRNILVHDSIFHPCLGSVPFPPFGALPAGHHIGDNAFLHFTKSG
jgi:tetratricopeptide (TPR) repeat protein